MINDKTELLAEIVTRSDYADIIPRQTVFIGLAEKSIEKQLRLSEMIKTVTLTLDAFGSGVLPTDLLEISEVRKPNLFLSKAYNKNLIINNLYIGYYLEANKIYNNPPTGTLSLVYYQKIPSLNTVNTNWLLDLDPNIYITALMMQVYQNKDDLDKAVLYKNYLAELLNDLQVAGITKRFGDCKMTASGVV